MGTATDQIVDLVLRNLTSEKVFLLGVSGCQGSGKTTATRAAAAELTGRGIPTAAVSLDDYYLTHDEQLHVARSGNKLLQKRGLPGTHDIQLLQLSFKELRAGVAQEVPTYDKSLFDGAGDRSSPRILPSKYRVVLLEGWFLGFRPLGESKIKDHRSSVHDTTSLYTEQDIVAVDTNLRQYLPFWDALDVLVYLRPRQLNYVYVWREQQEAQLRLSTGAGMTPEQVKAFVDGYMPCYDLYADTVKADVTLWIGIDHQIENP